MPGLSHIHPSTNLIHPTLSLSVNRPSKQWTVYPGLPDTLSRTKHCEINKVPLWYWMPTGQNSEVIYIVSNNTVETVFENTYGTSQIGLN